MVSMNQDMAAWQALGSGLGLEMPSTAYLVGAVMFSLIGMVAWTRGRRAQRPVMRWSGLALMLYGYGVSSTWLLYAVGAALTAVAFMSEG